MPIGGVIGPRGMRRVPCASAASAREHHAAQIELFADIAIDYAVAYTQDHAEEAIGIALAARAARIPLALSFTVETNGRLASGESLAGAIERTDAETGDYPSYYLINCAHPTHYEHVLQEPAPWRDRIRGLR